MEKLRWGIAWQGFAWQLMAEFLGGRVSGVRMVGWGLEEEPTGPGNTGP